MTVKQFIEALANLSAKDRLTIYRKLCADEGLRAYRSLAEDVERAQRSRREREIKRRAAQARPIREARCKRDKKRGGLRAYTVEELSQQ